MREISAPFYEHESIENPEFARSRRLGDVFPAVCRKFTRWQHRARAETPAQESARMAVYDGARKGGGGSNVCALVTLSGTHGSVIFRVAFPVCVLQRISFSHPPRDSTSLGFVTLTDFPDVPSCPDLSSTLRPAMLSLFRPVSPSSWPSPGRAFSVAVRRRWW